MDPSSVNLGIRPFGINSSDFGLWVMIHGSCDVTHDVKDILGMGYGLWVYGLWTLGHASWVLPIMKSYMMSCNGLWVKLHRLWVIDLVLGHG